MPRGSQGLIRGARGSQTGLTETAWRRPKLPRSCLGRLWDLPGRPPGAILEQILIPNSMILLQTFLKLCLLKFQAKFHVFLFCSTLQIHCNLQWNLHVFRFGPFQKYMQNLYRKNMEMHPKFRQTSQTYANNAQQITRKPSHCQFQSFQGTREANMSQQMKQEAQICTKT